MYEQLDFSANCSPLTPSQQTEKAQQIGKNAYNTIGIFCLILADFEND